MSTTTLNLTLMRFTANGLPDTTFNGGSPVLHYANTQGVDRGLRRRPPARRQDRRGRVGPRIGSADPRGDFLAARFNPNGTLDTSFNNGSGWIRVAPVAGGINYGPAAWPSMAPGGSWSGAIVAVGRRDHERCRRRAPQPGRNPGDQLRHQRDQVRGLPRRHETEEDGLAIGNDGNYYLAGSVQPSSGNGETLVAYFTP